MNIQVSLLKSTEVRSASMVSVKTYILIAALVIPLVLIFVLGMAWMRYSDRANTLAVLEHQWEDAQRNQRVAAALLREVEEIQSIHQAVYGWHTSRGPWAKFLQALPDVVPAEIQLLSLQMRATPEAPPGGELIQSFRVTLTGRCVGPDADERVEMLRYALASMAPFDEWTERARVSSFAEDTGAGAGPLDRVFQIDVYFQPRSYDEVAGE